MQSLMLATEFSENSRLVLQLFETLKVGRESILSVLSVFSAPALQPAMSGSLPTPNKKDFLNTLHA